jgi:hypothetical protein
LMRSSLPKALALHSPHRKLKTNSPKLLFKRSLTKRRRETRPKLKVLMLPKEVNLKRKLLRRS